MFYIQAGVNQSSDYFIFDVTNGITWLHGLILKIVIIPEYLYIQTKNVSVEEGNMPMLSVTVFNVTILLNSRSDDSLTTRSYDAIL